MSSRAQPIRVVVAHDSPLKREHLQQLIECHAGLSFAGSASNTSRLVQLVSDVCPDVALVDGSLGGFPGLSAVRETMSAHPLPVVVLDPGGEDAKDRERRAYEAGAVAFVSLEAGLRDPDLRHRLVKTIGAMAEVKVVHRKRSRHGDVTPAHSLGVDPAAGPVDVVVMGASTGGPPALRAVLEGLPASFPAPVLIVQHLSPGFNQGLRQYLAESSKLSVEIAQDGVLPREGCVYLAPDGVHMGFSNMGRIALSDGPPENGSKPSVSFLFRSAARSHGSAVAAVLLTGMGRDGARELKQIRDAGGATIAQDEQSSAVHGMPGEAIRLQAARYVLPPERIPGLLVRLATAGGWRGLNAGLLTAQEAER